MGARSWSTLSPPPPPPPPGPLPCLSPASPSSSPPLSPASNQHRKQQHHQQHLRRSKHQKHEASGHQVIDLLTPLPSYLQAHTTTVWSSQPMIPVSGSGGQQLPSPSAVAAATQQLERHLSVRQDLALDLPPCLALPDGEEKPYGSSTRLRIRDYDQESEIYRECIRPPPNRTVYESGEHSLLPFRCNSVGILSDPVASSKQTSSFAPHGTPSWEKEKELPSSRVVLDINGQPVVMRSKSMSTGSSLYPSSTLAVMVPSSSNQVKRHTKSSTTCSSSTYTSGTKDPSNKGIEAAVKSCVRSLCEKVSSSVRTEKTTPATGVDNGAFESGSNQILNEVKPKVNANSDAAKYTKIVEQSAIRHYSVQQAVVSTATCALGSLGSSATTSRSSKSEIQIPFQQHQQQTSSTTECNSSSSKLANLPVVSCLTYAVEQQPPPAPET